MKALSNWMPTAELKARLESIRLQAGPRMNLGDVSQRNVPKMCLIAPAQAGGALSTRTFIPHRCHTSIGVFGAVSVAVACLIEGSVAAGMASVGEGEVRRLRSSTRRANSPSNCVCRTA